MAGNTSPSQVHCGLCLLLGTYPVSAQRISLTNCGRRGCRAPRALPAGGGGGSRREEVTLRGWRPEVSAGTSGMGTAGISSSSLSSLLGPRLHIFWHIPPLSSLLCLPLQPAMRCVHAGCWLFAPLPLDTDFSRLLDLHH